MKIRIKKSFPFSENGKDIKTITEGEQDLSDRICKYALLMDYAEEIEKGGDINDESPDSNSSNKRTGKSKRG
jgi:hypothetical protein